MTIGLDTNILVRYLTDDDPAQADKVENFFGSYEDDTSFLINDVVVAELDWVLTSVYKLTREDFLTSIYQLLETKNIIFHSHDVILKTCRVYEKNNADFSDCYLGILNQKFGCETTYTFDKKASKLSSFTLLK